MNKTVNLLRLFHYLQNMKTREAGMVALCCAGVGLLGICVLLGYFATIAREHGVVRFWLTPGILLLGVVLFQLAGQFEPLAVADAHARNNAIRAWIIAGGCWMLFLPISIALLVFGGPPDLQWSKHVYIDKRWAIVVYWSSILAVIVLPLLFHGLLVISSRTPETWKAVALAVLDLQSIGHQSFRRLRSTRTLGACILFGLILATLLFGPPWNTDNLAQPPNLHETIHWSGLQAISHGYTPYLGPASNNYGPGMQLFIYGYMKMTNQFSIPGFRESFGVSLWVSLLLAYAITFSSLRFIPALISALLMLLISPVVLWTWWQSGVLIGYFGWSNTLRTIGTLALALSFSKVAFLRRSNCSFIIGAVGVGLLWGLLAYYSQENLLGGLITLGLLVVVLYLTGTFTFQKTFVGLLAIAAGFLAIWLPIILFYFYQGAFGEFWQNYFLVPSRFLRGYANTPYLNGLADPFAVSYYTLPFMVTLLAVLPIYKFGPFRFAGPLTSDRFLIVAASIAFLTAYTSAMLRADQPHLLSTFFPLPVIIAVALFYLPPLMSRYSLRRWIIRFTVIFLTANVFFPTWLEAPTRLENLFKGRLKSFWVEKAAFDRYKPVDEVDRRFGPSINQSPAMREISELIKKVKKIVKEESTFVDVQTRGYLVDFYFLADLRPGPILMERSDMVADSKQLDRFLAHFKENIEHFDHIVSLNPKSQEIEIFKEAYPNFLQQIVEGAQITVYIFSKN